MSPSPNRTFWMVLVLIAVSLLQLFVLVSLHGDSECVRTSDYTSVCSYR